MSMPTKAQLKKQRVPGTVAVPLAMHAALRPRSPLESSSDEESRARTKRGLSAAGECAEAAQRASEVRQRLLRLASARFV